MPIDPDIAAQVAHLFDATLAQVLAGEVDGPPAAGPMRRDDVEIVDATVPGPGGPLGIRLYRSRSLDVADAAPALVWAHGGGWQFGGLDMPEADSVGQVVAATLPGVVVSVDYRLAPAHRWPAPLDDVVSAHRWATTRGAAHGIDPGRVALGGASAGAHLAAGAAVAFEAADAPTPAALLLAYPVTDPVGGPYPQDRPDDCPPLLWLDAEAITGLFEKLVDDVTRPPALAIPAAVDLTGLPPTLVATAELDALAPQARRWAGLARDAGVTVTSHEVEGLLHGYLNTVGDSAAADRALARHVDWLRAVLEPARTGARNVGIPPGNY